MTDRQKKEKLEFEARSILGNRLFDSMLPPSDQDALEVLSATEAAALLRSGQPLRRKRIVGDLVLGQEDLGNPFEFEFDGGRRAVLANLPWPKVERRPAPFKVELEECFVTGNAIFAGLWLQESISITSTTFHSEVDFQFSQFDKPANFYRCRFQAKAKFSDSVFASGAYFDLTRFDDRSDFYHTSFLDGASFDSATFQSESNFSQSTFNSHGPVNLSLSFRHCVCHEAVYFNHATFEKSAEFAETQFRRHVDFLGASFDYVNFVNTDFQRLELTWEQIAGGKLLFGPVIIEGLDTSQPTIEADEFERLSRPPGDVTLPVKHRQYDILKAIFTKQGDYVSADGCFYEWKQVERRESPLGWNPESWIVKAFHYLNWLSCGYGAKPIRALFFAVVLVLLFAAAYSALDPNAGIHWSPANGSPLLQVLADASTMLLRNLEFSFRTFMSFGPIENTRGPVITLLFLIERLLGWLTLFLFVATYTRIMLR